MSAAPEKEIEKAQTVVDEIISSEESHHKGLIQTVKFILALSKDPKLKNIPEVKKLLKLSKSVKELEGLSADLYFSMSSVTRNSSRPFVVANEMAGQADKIAELYGNAAEILPKIQSIHSKLLLGKAEYKSFISKFCEEIKIQDPMSLYITPIQRGPRYRLLLESVRDQFKSIKYNKKDPDMNELEKNIEKISLAAASINEQVRYKEMLKSSIKSEVSKAKRITFFTGIHFDFSDFKKGSAKEANLKKVLEKIPKNEMKSFSYKKLSSDKLQVKITMPPPGKESYTFSIKRKSGVGGKLGRDEPHFHVKIDEDISRLSYKERNKLFEIGRKIGKTISLDVSPNGEFKYEAVHIFPDQLVAAKKENKPEEGSAKKVEISAREERVFKGILKVLGYKSDESVRLTSFVNETQGNNIRKELSDYVKMRAKYDVALEEYKKSYNELRAEYDKFSATLKNIRKNKEKGLPYFGNEKDIEASLEKQRKSLEDIHKTFKEVEEPFKKVREHIKNTVETFLETHKEELQNYSPKGLAQGAPAAQPLEPINKSEPPPLRPFLNISPLPPVPIKQKQPSEQIESAPTPVVFSRTAGAGLQPLSLGERAILKKLQAEDLIKQIDTLPKETRKLLTACAKLTKDKLETSDEYKDLNAEIEKIKQPKERPRP